MTSSISSLLSADTTVEPEGDDPAFEESIILEPHQASSIESAWLEMMTRDQAPDIRALFDRIMKYLNGQHAIEKISVREGISRKDVRRVLGVFDEFIIYVCGAPSVQPFPFFSFSVIFCGVVLCLQWNLLGLFLLLFFCSDSDMRCQGN